MPGPATSQSAELWQCCGWHSHSQTAAFRATRQSTVNILAAPPAVKEVMCAGIKSHPFRGHLPALWYTMYIDVYFKCTSGLIYLQVLGSLHAPSDPHLSWCQRQGDTGPSFTALSSGYPSRLFHCHHSRSAVDGKAIARPGLCRRKEPLVLTCKSHDFSSQWSLVEPMRHVIDPDRGLRCKVAPSPR